MSVPFYGPAGRFLGVVSAAFLPDKVVKSLFNVRQDAAVRALYLIDNAGHVLAASGEASPLERPAPETNVTAVFPLPELVQRIKAGQTGVIETRLGGEQVVIAYDEVSPFGWSVVAVADAKRLLDRSDSDTPAY